MRKDVLVRASVDQETGELLDKLARIETEGNRSMMLRRAIREAGKRRGVFVTLANGQLETGHGEGVRP